MTRRLVLIAPLLGLVPAALIAGASGSDDRAAAQQPLPAGPRTLVLQVGDTVRVQGAKLACAVTRRGGRATIECRRTGRRAGTYGTFIGERTAIVARFHARDTAQVVFEATHGGGWKACRAPAARARTAALWEHCR